MSAETSGQLICRGVGQNVSPRERIDISSVDKEQLDRLITEEWSKWMLAGLVLRRERLRVTVEEESLCVTLDGMSLVLALVLLTCWLRLLSVRLWSIVPRKRAAKIRHLTSRSSFSYALVGNIWPSGWTGFRKALNMLSMKNLGPETMDFATGQLPAVVHSPFCIKMVSRPNDVLWRVLASKLTVVLRRWGNMGNINDKLHEHLVSNVDTRNVSFVI